MNKVNSPTSLIPSLANPKDSSSYSGIGGVVNSTGVTGAGVSGGSKSGGQGSELSASNSYGSTSGSGLGGASNNGVSSGSSQNYATGLDDSASEDSDLENAAKLTGLKEGEVKSMLEGSEKDRRNLEGNDSDSLFGKVSKAYLRNLDRVLTRKKAPTPAGTELKKPGLNERERDEIKRIFQR